MRKYSLLLLFLVISLSTHDSLYGQATPEEVVELYEYNIQQEYLNDIYIPIDVEDAMKQLDILSDDDGKDKLKSAPEEVVADKLIKGLGRWMMINWNFYEGSRLSHRIRDYGVTIPEDQAKFLITTYHRYLNNLPLNLEQRGKEYFEMRRQEQINKLVETGKGPK